MKKLLLIILVVVCSVQIGTAQDAEVKKAVQLGKTIFQHKPNCRAALDYINFTSEFLQTIETKI